MHGNGAVKSEKSNAYARQTCTSLRYRHIAWIPGYTADDPSGS